MTTTPNAPTADGGRTPDELADYLDGQIVETETKIRDNDAAVAAIADRIRAGEDVDPDAMPRQRSLADHWRLFLDGLRERKAAALRDARLLRLSAVRDDIEARAADDEDQVNVLVLAAADAQVVLRRHLEERQEFMNSRLRTLIRERVPGFNGPSPEPAPAHGGLATRRGDLVAGRTQLVAMNPDRADELVRIAVTALLGGEVPRRIQTVTTTREPADDCTYWTHAGHGGVQTFGPAGPPEHALKVDPELGVPSLRQITFWEAVQLGWRDADERGPEIGTY